MARIRIDLRFVDIPYELWALEKCLGTIDQQITSLREQHSAETVDRIRTLRAKGHDDEARFLEEQIDELNDHVLPRLVRNPFLVATWATYEGGVTEIAHLLAHSIGARLRLGNIRGGGFVSEAQLYFEGVLNLALEPDPRRVEQLNTLLLLRNAIAHGGARKGASKKGTWDTIERMAAAGADVCISRDLLIVGRDLVAESYKAVRASLDGLIARSRHS